MENKANMLFEVSWEVCNKVGGIYTVIASKARRIKEYYDGNYFLIGPYFPDQAIGNFKEKPCPEKCVGIYSYFESIGIKLHFGNWLIQGDPEIILIDFENYKIRGNEIKKFMWDHFKVDSLNSPYDYTEPVIFSYVAGMIIEKYKLHNPSNKIVAQFHEWLTGSGILYLKQNNVLVGTVFTTHATILGRSIASSNQNLYEIWDTVNTDEEARRLGIYSKFSLERASAKNCDIFTTVSEITGLEAEKLLGRKPDVILPNGLDIDKFPTIEESSIRHKLFRDKIKDFLMFYFFPHYSFNLDETLIYFLAGRYEYHDKGVDIYLKALAKLNDKLKEEHSEKTIVAFIWIPAGIKDIKREILQSRSNYEDIRDSLNDIMPDIKHNILKSILTKEKITEKSIFSDDFNYETQKKVMRFVKTTSPPLVTHNLDNPDDIIVKTLINTGLDNQEDDRVKVIFYPIYLTGADHLLDLNYYEAMEGSHLGIFPSFYEPWGYTPLEAGALGVPSVTTDLSGFGRYFVKYCDDKDIPGIYILKRLNVSDDVVTDDLSNVMYKFANLSKKERVDNKIKAKRVASLADWKHFIEYYIEAHNKAVK